MAQIYPFPSRQSQLKPSWPHKIVCALAYLAMAYLAAASPGNVNILGFMLAGLAYYAFVHTRRWQWATVPFVRFHLLQAIVLFLVVGLLLTLVFHSWTLVVATVQLIDNGLANKVGGLGITALLQLHYLGLKLLGWVSAVLLLVNRQPRYPWVSDIVERQT